ncbi:MAG: InlB B-repeat-containing protein, partial [Clostridia bacterium]|nr:InlB B-repeat-containing protein [Clostridia bacterium]
MKRNTVISIVIAALLCVVLLAMNPLSVGAQDSNRSTFSGNNNEGYSNPRKVTFIGSDYRKTLVVESGATVSNLPELPDPDEGTEWKWMIDGTDAGFTANTKVTADLTVTAVQRITNPVQDKDFMNGASGVIVNHVGGSTTHKEKHAALLSSFSSHKEANGKWLAAAVTEDVDVNRLTTWTFEFTGNCKENSNKDCYYYVRSSSGYLKVLPNNALTISNDNEPSQILVHKNNLNDPTFFLGDPDGKWWVNLKRDNPDCGFQSYDQMNDSTRLSFYTVPEKSFVTLSFDTNGGNRPAPDPIKAYAGDKVLSSTLPWNYSGTKNGHAFIGWAPNQSAVDPLYKNDEGETLSYEMPEHGGTLYAVYDSDPILWLDPLNGENAVVCTNLSELTDLNKKPERDGYFFAGWAKNPFMPEIVDFDTFELDKDTTLFAVWKKYVTVTFHYAETTPVPKQFYEGQTIELDLLDGVTPVKEGWVYYQNNISSSATKPWTVPSGVDSIDLYEVKTVNLTIDKNDGTTLSVIDNVKTGNSVSLVDYISTRDNCKLE